MRSAFLNRCELRQIHYIAAIHQRHTPDSLSLRGITAIRKNYLTLNMLTKEKVIGAINKLPQEFSVEQAIDELILLEKIETGLQQSKDNNVIPDEKLDEELPEWLR